MLVEGVITKRYLDGNAIPDEDVTSAEIASKIGYDVEIQAPGAPALFENVAPQRGVRWPDETPGMPEEPFWTLPFPVGTVVVVATFRSQGVEDSYIVAPRELPYFAACESLEGGVG